MDSIMFSDQELLNETNTMHAVVQKERQSNQPDTVISESAKERLAQIAQKRRELQAKLSTM
jgi:hypothetical protein